jgi:hypothetical protein
VSGLFGGSTSAAGLIDIPALLPGASLEVNTSVAGVFPSFRLKVTAQVSPVASVVNPKDAVPKAVSKSVGVWAIPWTLIALLIVLGVAIWRGVAWFRHRPPTPTPPKPPTPTPVPDDDDASPGRHAAAGASL